MLEITEPFLAATYNDYYKILEAEILTANNGLISDAKGKGGLEVVTATCYG